MKKLLIKLSVAAFAMSAGFVYADTEADIPVGARIRANNVNDGDFNSPSVWNQYDNNGWQDVTMSVVPWEIATVVPAWEGRQVLLKLDFSTLTTTEAIGSASNLVDMTVTGIYRSTINIEHDFYITGNFAQDGNYIDWPSYINISNGATASISGMYNIMVNLDSATLISRGESEIIAPVLVANGSTFYQKSGWLYLSEDLTVEDSTFYGKITTRNGAEATFTNSTFNFGKDNESIGMNNQGSIVFDDSLINAYYSGWDTSSETEAKWNGNVLFLGLGENTDSTITFRNGTIVNGVGLADGTGFWDLTPEQYGNISGGGNVNLGWNKFTSETDVFTLNLESGSKFSAWSLEFANAGACQSQYGTVIWNQGGTDMDSGYTESFFVGDVNVRMGTVYFEDGEFGSWLNLLGYTSIYGNSNLNIGNNEAASGSATFTMTGANNTANFNSVYFNSGNNTEQSSGVATFDMGAGTSDSVFHLRDKWESFVGVGATHIINIDGTDNEFYVENDFNLTNKALVDGNTVKFSLKGEGNTLDVKNFKTSNDGTQDSATGGSIVAAFEGDNAANKNNVYIRSGEMILQASQAAGSTMSISYLFKGNTTLSNGSGKGVWLKVNEWGGKQYTSDVLFEVSGSGNELLLSGLEIGKDTPNLDEGYGKGVFRIVGGGSEIIIQNDGDGHNGFKLNSGGLLEYVVDDTGITAITNRAWQNSSINGMLRVDFTEITTPQEEARYVLFQTTDKTLSWEGRMADNWFDFTDPDDLYIKDDDFVQVILADPIGDVFRFALEEEDIGDYSYQQLVIYYSNSIIIPEPSTVAAVFGALALAFAAYRRRK